jgi:hypothetical protein
MNREVEIISRDEIRLDAERVRIVWKIKDEWGRELVDSVELERPLKEWKSPTESPSREASTMNRNQKITLGWS